jgi:hypothetical protein
VSQKWSYRRLNAGNEMDLTASPRGLHWLKYNYQVKKLGSFSVGSLSGKKTWNLEANTTWR